MKKTIKKILFTFLIISLNFLSIKTFGQKEKLIIGGGFGMLSSHTVQINNMKYVNGTSIASGTSIKIPSGGNVNIKFDVVVTKNDGINNGFVKIYYKSTQNSTPVAIGNTEYHNNPQNTYWSTSYEVNLTNGMFTQGFTGSLYAQFENNAGAGWKSSSYSVIMDTSSISNNTIGSNQTIIQGAIPSTLVGSNPTGGNGNYFYQWQKKTSGNWSNISGATAKNYISSVLNSTTYFRRIVSSTGSPNSTSNIVKITVTIPLGNNVICCDQTLEFGEIPSALTGSTPQGGSSNYTYRWLYRHFINGFYGPWSYVLRSGNFATSMSLNFNSPFADYSGVVYQKQYKREVFSGIGENIESNIITIIQNPEVQGIRNNTIFTNTSGSGIFTGSTPTGGSGNYTYQWYVTSECPSNDVYYYAERISGATSKNYTVPQNLINNNQCNETTFFFRVVTDSQGRTNTSTDFINIYGESGDDHFSSRSTSIGTKKKKMLESSREKNVETAVKEVVGKNFNVFVDNLSEKLIVKSRITESTHLTISLISILDGRTYKVFEEKVRTGDWQYEWNKPKNVRNGLYICRVEKNGEVFNKKIIIK